MGHRMIKEAGSDRNGLKIYEEKDFDTRDQQYIKRGNICRRLR
jgi:hypothetical protein